MSYQVTNLHPHVGAEVASDLASMLGGESGGEFQNLLLDRGVLLFRNVEVNDEDLLTFSKTIAVVRKEKHNPVNKVHLTKSGDSLQQAYMQLTFLWHVDSTYEDDPPLGAILVPRTLPPNGGGDTEFVSTCAAYEALSDADKKLIENLQVVHTMTAYGSKVPAELISDEFRDSWPRFPARTLPMVRPQFKTGRKALILGSSADHVVGMDRAESDALIKRLNAHMTSPQFIMRHEWKMGDVLIWDNTSTMHRATPYPADCGRKHARVQFYAHEYKGDMSEFGDNKATLNRMRGGEAA
jgi:alpha-ketoglutarate-dependent taurine dioxygenase